MTALSAPIYGFIDCVTCGDTLSATEIKNGEDTCYPCQKGNTEESQKELR